MRKNGRIHLWYLAFLLLILFFVTSCSSTETSQVMKKPAPLKVAFAMNPSAPKVSEPATVSVQVEQEGGPVNDADEVKFEIWQKGSEDHQLVRAVKTGNGIYAAQKTFEKPGVYDVMYHITARDLHKMITYEVTVTGTNNSQHK